MSAMSELSAKVNDQLDTVHSWARMVNDNRHCGPDVMAGFLSELIEAAEAARNLVTATQHGGPDRVDDYWTPEPMSAASAEFMARQPGARPGVSS